MAITGTPKVLDVSTGPRRSFGGTLLGTPCSSLGDAVRSTGGPRGFIDALRDMLRDMLLFTLSMDCFRSARIRTLAARGTGIVLICAGFFSPSPSPPASDVLATPRSASGPGEKNLGIEFVLSSASSLFPACSEPSDPSTKKLSPINDGAPTKSPAADRFECLAVCLLSFAARISSLMCSIASNIPSPVTALTDITSGSLAHPRLPSPSRFATASSTCTDGPPSLSTLFASTISGTFGPTVPASRNASPTYSRCSSSLASNSASGAAVTSTT
mmetsp:Transcript_18778/g.47224  ORF Transcript_18778/g.47224 Transcript_18778/m.47224 type:complete len:272 (+) Transcript_18778:724-1539(+)